MAACMAGKLLTITMTSEAPTGFFPHETLYHSRTGSVRNSNTITAGIHRGERQKWSILHDASPDPI